MKRGLFLRSENNDFINIFSIIKLLNNYCFILDNCEIYNDKNQPFELEGFYTYNEINDILKKQKAKVIFLRLQAYAEEALYECIENYSDFIHSKCELVLMISDAYIWEVYCKQDTMITNILNEVRNGDFYDIDYITEKNDERYSFRLN